MLWVELSPLLCIKWFEPVGSRLELVVQNIKDESLEGISKADISILRQMNNNVSNLPNDMRFFLSAIGDYLLIENSSKTVIPRYRSAIHALGWNVSMNHNMSNYYSEILSELWIDIYGYSCPFDFI